MSLTSLFYIYILSITLNLWKDVFDIKCSVDNNVARPTLIINREAGGLPKQAEILGESTVGPLNIILH